MNFSFAFQRQKKYSGPTAQPTPRKTTTADIVLLGIRLLNIHVARRNGIESNWLVICCWAQDLQLIEEKQSERITVFNAQRNSVAGL